MMGPQTSSRTRPFQRKWLHWVWLLSGWLLLASCDTTTLMSPPLVDKQRFSPLPESQRVIVKPKVKYLVRQDGYEFCARITGIPMSLGTRVMACAFWNVRRNECTIVTPLKTGYNYVGHELRHCFEGAFHD
ncbi:hypothetical protein [Limnohabitans sp.]|jgi:hypothetical protein|uniref:hypothetical protein n=1 Tax=Limnohabitans sp. TaxID=1907725 RepID=UPI0037C17062